MASSAAVSGEGGGSSRVKIAVIQLNSTAEKEANFDIARQLIESATADGARMAFLPECFDSIYPSRAQTLENGEPVDGPTVAKYRELAKTNKIWLSLGGLHEKNAQSSTTDDKRLFNAHIVLNDSGEIVSVYRKVHLFNLDIPGTRLVESEFSQPGSAVISPVKTPAGSLGMGICYDLRFAEFAISLAKAGADIISVCCCVVICTQTYFTIVDYFSILPPSRSQRGRLTGRRCCELGPLRRSATLWVKWAKLF